MESIDVSRFIVAQDPIFTEVLKELKQGKKQSHWMWYVFPQIEGLGKSEFAKKYAIHSIDEAKTYYQHKVLGARLLQCTQYLLNLEDKSAEDIFGFPDCLKLHSCMTLFHEAVPSEAFFKEVLDQYFNGQLEAGTIDHLSKK